MENVMPINELVIQIPKTRKISPVKQVELHKLCNNKQYLQKKLIVIINEYPATFYLEK